MRLHKPLFKQSGFSIIELMIAITISLLLTAAVALLYTSSRTSARNQSDLARVQETGRNAMYILTRSVRQGGFLADPTSWVNLQTIFPGPNSRPVQGTQGAAGANDTLMVSYQGSGTAAGVADNRIVNCLGEAVPYPSATGTIRRDVFTIATVAPNPEPVLYCDDGAGVTTRVPLVEGVEAMQILYGEDTDNPRDMTANRYVVASSVSNWYNVVSVRISILVRSPNDIRLAPDTTNYNLLGATFTPPTSPTDTSRRLRQLFTTVVNVRNLSN